MDWTHKTPDGKCKIWSCDRDTTTAAAAATYFLFYFIKKDLSINPVFMMYYKCMRTCCPITPSINPYNEHFYTRSLQALMRMQFKFNTEYITMHYKDLQDLGEAKETYVKGYCKQVIVLFILCFMLC